MERDGGLVVHACRLITVAERARVAALISGRGSNMAALIEAAAAPECPFEIVLVVSNDPAAAGLSTARAAGIATYAHPHRGMPRAAHEALIDAELRAARVEWIALAGYMRLLSPGFAAAWAGRIVNIHPSLLPAYKGLDTHARAIAAGDTEAGCTVHIVTAELDDGPILGQSRVPILPGDTPDALAARVLVEEHRLYPRALADLVRSAGQVA
jgi:phosphoribosylglycinamide formyltransferase-1